MDLSALARDAVDQLIPLAREKGLRLILEGQRGDQPAVPAVWADPSKTTEVLINLIGNAVKYTKEGSVTVTVKKAPDPVRSGQAAIVEIADTGIGMSPEALSHLFQKFYRVQTEATRGIQGTGLGLYITRQLVEKMGGTLAVQSAEGNGTTFTLTLPPVPVRNR